eukprot:scaffold1677_cov122-Cylindrotheca_fusiformis.AAC.8
MSAKSFSTAIVLASLCALAVLPQLSFADETGGMACDNGPDALAQFGAEQTCIESPDFEGERCYYTFIPDCAGEDSPLIYDLHGFGSCPAGSVGYTGWREKAEEHCFIVVYPVGTWDSDIVDTNCWNLPGGFQLENGTTSPSCCCEKDDEPISTFYDGPFLRQIAAVLSRDIPDQTSGNVTIDTKRIYMAGHSNGCMTSLSMAAQYSDMVAAVGCHSGTGISPFPEGNFIPRPIATVHGAIDMVIGYDTKVDQLFTALETYDAISTTYNCTTFNETPLSNEANDTATKRVMTDCSNNATVVMYVVDQVGHFPFPGDYTMFGEPGVEPMEFDTTKWMWDFLKQYSLEEAPDLVVTAYSDDDASPSADDGSSSPRMQTGSFAMVTAIGVVALFANSGM